VWCAGKLDPESYAGIAAVEDARLPHGERHHAVTRSNHRLLELIEDEQFENRRQRFGPCVVAVVFIGRMRDDTVLLSFVRVAGFGWRRRGLGTRLNPMPLSRQTPLLFLLPHTFLTRSSPHLASHTTPITRPILRPLLEFCLNRQQSCWLA